MRLLLISVLLLWAAGSYGQTFAEEQLRFPRVREAKSAVDQALQAAFEAKGLSYPPSDLFIRAFKHEQELEVWVQESSDWHLFRTYPICRLSGNLGPKRKEGDGQIPEGFYRITTFNPASNFHLSMQVNYPNASDRKLSDPNHPGGLIYIHGACVTIGCIPITNEWIRELYWLAVQAKSNGGALPVHIFPFRMDAGMVQWARSTYAHDEELLRFWESLLPGYQRFEEHGEIVQPSLDENGYYSFE